MLNSLVILTPKQGLIAQFAGKYKGEYVKHGFFAKNPFYGITTYNLGQQNATTEVLKINDKDGNPIMIQAVLVYKIISMYKTHYDVVNSSAYLLQQANASLRAITKKFSYKNNEFNENFENELLSEINKYAAIAGFEVESAHTTELSYAPEIAGAMLQKQQAEATIDAKKSLVEGAVSIVKETIEALSKENNGVQLDEESKRRLTVNLLTVLAGEQRPIATIPISDSVH